jgi:hypothetical protein
LSEAISILKYSKSEDGTNQYLAMSVKFLAHGNNGLPLTGFELTSQFKKIKL